MLMDSACMSLPNTNVTKKRNKGLKVPKKKTGSIDIK